MSPLPTAEQTIAARCWGDGVHAELRVTHDWRLWERLPVVPTAEHVTADEYHFVETWYCTRCRTFETREI